MRQFEKRTTNVGGCTGIIIPNQVLYAEGIQRGDKVRVILERVVDEAQEGLKKALCAILPRNLQVFPQALIVSPAQAEAHA